MEPNMTIYPSFTDVFTFDMLEGTKDALKDPEKILISESQAKKDIRYGIGCRAEDESERYQRAVGWPLYHT